MFSGVCIIMVLILVCIGGWDGFGIGDFFEFF